LQMDGQVHARYRQITQGWFARQRVGSFEHRIRLLVGRTIDRMAARGDSCDFVRDVALRSPLLAIMEILGIPEDDEPLLLDLLQELLRSQDEASAGDARASRDPARHSKRVLEAFAGFERYFVPLIEERRKKPRDDLASVVGVAEIEGKQISQFEAVCYYMLLVTAGHHTSAAALSGAIWALCENSDEFRKIKSDSSLLPLLVEEAVRWTTPVHHMMRTATEASEMHGRRIAKGDWLMLCYLSGNSDEQAFDAPERFQINPDRGRSVGFGYGVHACLGQHLARLEMRIFFEELFRRLSWIELSGTPRRIASVFLGGPRTMPIKFAMV